MSSEDMQSDDSQTLVTRRDALSMSAAVGSAALLSNVSAERVLAQSGGPSDEISGTVEDSSGTVEGATVVAVPHDESLDPLVTTTASDGTYIFAQSDLHDGENMYHVIARDGTESDPRRGVPNYPFIAAEGFTTPDSAIHHWRYGEGSGSTAADDIGNADGSITGASWVSGTYVGDNALDADGTDDNVDPGTLGSFGSNLGNGYSIAATIETTNTGILLGTLNDGTATAFTFGNDDGFASNGRWYHSVRGDGDNQYNTLELDTAINDGTKTRVVITVPDMDPNNWTFYVNGSEASASVVRNDQPSSFSDFQYPLTHFARNIRGSIDRHLNAIADDILLFDAALSASQIQDDYDRQPWS